MIKKYVKLFFCKNTILVYAGFLFFASQIMAHEDLDIGIEHVTFDKQCRLHYTLKNYGPPLSASFYNTVNPAFVSLEKGQIKVEFKSVRALDKRKRLMEAGGTLELETSQKFAENPLPLKLTLNIVGEFIDFGMANNFHTAYIDCVRGKGEIAGKVPAPTAPDIAVTHARILPETCLLEVTFENLTGLPLPPGAWVDEAGVAITRLDLDASSRAKDISLATLDPAGEFTLSSQQIEFNGDYVIDGASNMRVAMWRVAGDADFSNNHIDLAVPESCRTLAE